MLAFHHFTSTSSNPILEHFVKFSLIVTNSFCLSVRVHEYSVGYSILHGYEFASYSVNAAFPVEKGVSKGIWVMSNVKPKTTVSYSALYTDSNQCSDAVCMITSRSKSVPDV